jgi:hypothetical protein
VIGPIGGKLNLEMVGDLKMLVHLNLTDFSRGRSVSGKVDSFLFGRNWEYRPERYCMREHMIQTDFLAINSCLEYGSFFKELKM